MTNIQTPTPPGSSLVVIGLDAAAAAAPTRVARAITDVILNGMMMLERFGRGGEDRDGGRGKSGGCEASA